MVLLRDARRAVDDLTRSTAPSKHCCLITAHTRVAWTCYERMDMAAEAKRDKFRQRLTVAVQLIEERENLKKSWNLQHTPNEADFPTPLFAGNVAVQCAPIPFTAVETAWRQGRSVDDMLRDFVTYAMITRGPSFQFAEFTPKCR